MLKVRSKTTKVFQILPFYFKESLKKLKRNVTDLPDWRMYYIAAKTKNRICIWIGMLRTKDKKLIHQVLACHSSSPSVVHRQALQVGRCRGGLRATSLHTDMSLSDLLFLLVLYRHSFLLLSLTSLPTLPLSWEENWPGYYARRLQVLWVRATPQDQGGAGKFRFEVLADRKRTPS